jgi:hypothetical protein
MGAEKNFCGGSSGFLFVFWALFGFLKVFLVLFGGFLRDVLCCYA